MSVTFNGLDNEFAVSSGTNVNSGPDSSDFDYPPTSTKDLVITSHAGDPSPYAFSVGDSYDISWGGQGGDAIQDMVVIRSDPIGTGPGQVVVFEGIDSGGDPVQVVWTPQFDLETWYFDNFNSGQPPKFWTADQDPATDAVVCFAAGTRIDTPDGPVPVETLRIGDAITTRDHGAQPLVWTGARAMSGQDRAAPVVFAPGTIGNHAVLRLSQQHRVLVSGWQAELWFGAPEVLVPARAFAGQPGIDIRPCARITWHHVMCAAHHVLFAEGAACETLLPGKVAQGATFDPALPELADIFPDALADLPETAMTAAHPVIRIRDAPPLFGRCLPAVPAAAML